MKSRAAVLFEPGKPLEVCYVDVQDPKAGEVRIEIKAAGVCHTDLSVMTGSLKAPVPAILGHEGGGYRRRCWPRSYRRKTRRPRDSAVAAVLW